MIPPAYKNFAGTGIYIHPIHPEGSAPGLRFYDNKASRTVKSGEKNQKKEDDEDNYKVEKRQIVARFDSEYGFKVDYIIFRHFKIISPGKYSVN
jgi:hypothetical protein